MPKVWTSRKIQILLIWLLSFFLGIRALAVLHFLLSLDYSEVDPLRLSYFLVLQSAQALMLIFFLRSLLRKAERRVLQALMGLAVIALLLQYDDWVTAISALLTFGLSFSLYVRLFGYTLSPKKEVSTELTSG